MNYELDRLIKVEMDNYFPQLIIQTKISVEELIDTQYLEGDAEITKFIQRYRHEEPVVASKKEPGVDRFGIKQ